MSMQLQRSLLAVPVTSPQFAPKAAVSDADAVFLDLEDSVAPRRKDEARSLAIAALRTLDWRNKLVAVRINDLDTPWGYRDIVDVAESCPRLDTILLPKAGSAEDVRFVARLLTAIEARQPRERPLGIEALIETPAGVANVEAIAAASPRLQSLSFGVGDYSAAMRAPQTDFGVPDGSYGVLTTAAAGGDRQYHWNDQWHFALARMCNACRANGLRPIDGPFTSLDDGAGYLAAAGRARALGFEGKWAIHPSQIAAANAVFSPSDSELAWAQRVTEAVSQATEAGNGAARLDGRMIDLVHARQAEHVLARSRLISARLRTP